MRVARSAAAAGLLVAVVAGVPLPLLRWGVAPAALAGIGPADDGSALLAALTLLGWLCWAALTLSIAAELVNLIGRRSVRLRLPLLGGLQSVAGALVLAAFAPLAAASGGPGQAVPSDVAAATPGYTDDADASVAPGSAPTHLVQPGDDLWSLAEQLLGEGRQWRQLADLNPELLANPTVDLPVGTRLRLPEAAPLDGLHHSLPAGKNRTVTVQRGDTLSGLAEKHLGDAGRWPRIHRANDRLIDDPDLIDVGWRLVMPVRRSQSKTPAQARPPRKPPTVLPADGPAVEQPGPTASPPEPPVTPTPSTTATPAAETPAQHVDPAWPLIGGLSAAAAALVLGAVGVSRRQQLRARPLGRRINHPPVDVRRYETALSHRQRPDRTALLEKALRHLGAHVHRHNRPLPLLDRAVLDDVGVAFHWTGAAGEPPAGFEVIGSAWVLSAAAAAGLEQLSHPVPIPALVTLGRDAQGAWVMIDLEACSQLALDGSRPLRHAVVAAMAVELSCSPWAAELQLAVVGGDEMFVRAACPELVQFTSRPAEALDALESLVAERGEDDAATALLRVDPDRSEAGAAVVTLFAEDLTPDERDRLAAVLDESDLGVSAVVSGSGPTALVLTGTEADPSARFTPGDEPIQPQLIAAHTRAAIGTIFAATDDPEHGKAPWWSDGNDDNVRTLVPRRGVEVTGRPAEPERPPHPYLMLLGPIELAGAAGPEPARARRQCEEYCAWLLQHPRSTATRMAGELVVAETTRRSNMSRLRTWLGADAEGKPYLPEAYSGRIELHPAVTSDWHRLQLLIAPGLNRLAPDTLVAVLELVRGAPLADAAPGQWRWAEELRTDMMSVVRDAGVLLTRWALEQSDVDLARWAAARALLAAPEDELLLVERLHTEHLAGNRSEVERLVRWVTGQARALGVDLAPETVDACQRALEGRTRPRAVR